jgi:NTE family protein
MIALALSGGGSRAIAFHLGCMRALHDRGVLQNVKVISAVSGGSVIAALYAYKKETFEDFDKRVIGLLQRGLQRRALEHLFSPGIVTRIVATNLIARPLATLARFRRKQPPLRRWGSRTDALEKTLRDEFGDLEVGHVARDDLDIVFNACELRTGTAFRFGNRMSGGWRTGVIQHNRVSVAHAVTCSAAYPLILPALDREYAFTKNGITKKQRVVLTDGGVYDNLGVSCFEPGRDSAFSLHSYAADYIICCYAGHGQLSGEAIPFGVLSRMDASFQSVFRKVQDAGIQRLHTHKASGSIKGFILPYLGQQDRALPFQPADLVRREEVSGYPTNFAAMNDENMSRISMRGEQLTRILLSYYCPEL